MNRRKEVFAVMLVVAIVLIATLASNVGAALSAKMNLVMDIVYQKSLDMRTAQDRIEMTRGLVFQNGTGANQANAMWADTRSLSGSADACETLDINDGSLTDSHGQTLVLSQLKALYIRNNSTDANLIIGGAATVQLGLFSDIASDKLKLRPGGELFLTAPDANGLACVTNKKLKIAIDVNSATTYDIILVGKE
jgi:hypothetical protein